ncbi:MAG: inorganic pyrophosphatase [Chloroflexi bacterium]|nr:inorganic pyrophosphatase [Chloroflexota bacterium]
MMDTQFWNALEDLAARHQIKIDKPRGSKHAQIANLTYPVDYGYLDGTRSKRGGGVELYMGTLGNLNVTGVISMLDLSDYGSTMKLLIGCSAQEMADAVAVEKRGGVAATLIVRNPG